MILFKTRSDQNNTSKRTRLHQSFQNLLGGYAPEPPNISVADITILYESSHFRFRIFQSINQNALIIHYKKSTHSKLRVF